MPAPRKYPPGLRERAMRLVQEAREQDPELSLNAAVIRIGQRTGVNADTLRGWCKQADIDARRRPGVTSDDAKRIRELEAEVRELKRGERDSVGGILVLRAGARPATAVVTASIDDHREKFGVEPICRVLTEHGVPIASSTYYAHKSRPPPQRSVRDVELKTIIGEVHADRTKGRGVAGYRKMWHLLRRDGHQVARCTVARLMRELGLRGAVRGRRVRTTIADQGADRPADHVKREFTADAPNALWVVDFTYVPTWSGMCFTAFVTDVYSRRIVGWRTHHRMPTELPLDA